MSESLSIWSIPAFTNLGYRFHARSFRPLRADLSDQTVVVTGSTGGLGLETAQTLAGMGARLVVVGRNRDKLDKAVAAIDGRAVGLEADLSSMAEVRWLADQIIEQTGSIDVLINNVGVLLPERSETDEGIEKTLATNLAGQFLLTNLLIPTLVSSAPARIINISSGGMYSTGIRPDDLNFENGDYTGTAAYARTKRGQVILTKMWAERLQGTGVVVHAMHPGWAKTAGVAGSLPLFDKLMKPFLRSAAQGADTIIWLAAAPEAAASTGKFWFDRRQVPTHISDKTRESFDERQELWDRLEKLTGAGFPTEI